jgi:hypothetical protein
MTWIRSTVWVDAGGYSIVKATRSVASAAVIAAALQACSNSGQTEYWESNASLPGNVPTAAPYQQNIDQATLFFLCADGTIANLVIPAPILSMFLADQSTIDIASPLIIALIAACLLPGAELASATGSNAVSYIAGRLTSP